MHSTSARSNIHTIKLKMEVCTCYTIKNTYAVSRNSELHRLTAKDLESFKDKDTTSWFQSFRWIWWDL